MNITATLFGQMLTFAVLIWFVNRVLWRPLTQAMTQRTQRIEDGLRAAEQGKVQQRLAQEEAERLIQEARDKAAEILVQARERGAEIIAVARQEAHEEKARIVAAAKGDVQRQTQLARERLRRDLAGLVVEGAGRVVGAEIGLGRHAAMLDDLAARL